MIARRIDREGLVPVGTTGGPGRGPALLRPGARVGPAASGGLVRASEEAVRYLPLGSGRSILRGTPGPERFAEVIREAALREGMDERLVRAVVEVESGFRPDAVSPAGAMGLMQLMPGTARALGVRDAFDPASNVAGGTRYLRAMLDRFGSLPLALAAYNAGPGAVDGYGGIPPYRETASYVARVLQLLRQSQQVAEADTRGRGGDGGGQIA